MIEPRIEQVENAKQNSPNQEGLGEEMRRRPEKIDAAQEAQKQRRITEWRQRATNVRDEENKEHDDMHIVNALVIGAHDRTDHHHGCARCADQACHQGADRQKRSVHSG